MKLIIRQEALDDIYDAIAYLIDKQRVDAARGLWNAWEKSLDNIIDSPDRFPIVQRCLPRTDVREYWISRYKYRVIYLIKSKEVEIVAFRYGRRLDNDWPARIHSPNG